MPGRPTLRRRTLPRAGRQQLELFLQMTFSYRFYFRLNNDPSQNVIERVQYRFSTGIKKSLRQRATGSSRNVANALKSKVRASIGIENGSASVNLHNRTALPAVFKQCRAAYFRV